MVGVNRRSIRALAVCAALALPRLGVSQSVRPVSPESADTIELTNLENQFRRVTDSVAPSVVAISSTETATDDSDNALRPNALNGERLDALLQHTTRTVGTGFVIDSDGYILTNEHVIADSTQTWITTDDHKVYPAVVVGSDPRGDLAILKVAARNLQPVKFAPFDSVTRGTWTISLGNPYGLAVTGQMSMSVGVVSALGRSLPRLASQEHRFYSNLIQTTAQINPGNSGGPLFNLSGQVIGLCTAVILPQQQATNGIGFAMPITAELLKQIEDLKQGREIKYAYLGVMVSTPTDDQRRAANAEGGVRIDAVETDSPAASILHIGDFVVQVNDQPVNESDPFVRMVSQSSIDQPTKFSVYRDGQAMTLFVRLRQRELPSVAVHRENQRIHWRGMLLGPIPANWDFSPEKRPQHGLMVLSIDSASPMMHQGVRSGTVITSVAGKPVNLVTDLQEILGQTPAEQCRVEIAPLSAQASVVGP
ncbi:MAG TPA: trypsin-like peptidase domain-containing protein [Tepidisphaeraceae bacterium]|nr:trypsin-like peptidase domain-containing protein [Tepidisphaeraceae bacterium]